MAEEWGVWRLIKRGNLDSDGEMSWSATTTIGEDYCRQGMVIVRRSRATPATLPTNPSGA